jgi:Beta-ketoacyl synthase, N-terminal domain
MVDKASVITGWGAGLQHIPVRACAEAAGRRLLPIPTPVMADDRLRRATRECLLAVERVDQLLSQHGLDRADLSGPRTAVVYASASAYAAANWAFLHADTSVATYFPYTAPSMVPGEVTISFHIAGPYVSFLSGANAGLEALWHAVTLLAQDQCDRALILGIETFAECETLFTSARWLLSAPLVETALCWLLEPYPELATFGYAAGRGDDVLSMIDAALEDCPTTGILLCMPTLQAGYHTRARIRERWPTIPVSLVNERTGTCLASTPLLGLLLSLAETHHDHLLCISRWDDAWTMVRWPRLLNAKSRASHPGFALT